MNAVDGSEHYDKTSHEQSPSLLAIILDTNPAAWSLLSSTLSFSSAVANLLVFINAHLAANYTNKVAVIASHCDKATWLYPTPTEQEPPPPLSSSSHTNNNDLTDSTKRFKLNVNNGTKNNDSIPSSSSSAEETGNKYRPFRLVEEELIHNLTTLLASTSPDAVSRSPTTMIAGALTLALSYINRESIAYAESVIGSSGAADTTAAATTNTTTTTGDPSSSSSNNNTSLQSRILLVSVSPSTDLAHQYIPIMNAIFACQRLAIPIDILQLPLPLPLQTNNTTNNQAQQTSTNNQTPAGDNNTTTVGNTSNSTVFLQQAADATHGIFIAAQLPKSQSQSQASPASSQAFLTYLLTSLLPSPSTRAAHLILPTRIDVDFRAACFCHRNVVSVGFVCSICLSIFCSVPENADCLTCGTHLSLGNYGARPVVVPPARKSKKKQLQQHSTPGTPGTPGTPQRQQ
ncbi:RNA polymerase II transcription factor B subunit 4 [Exophiala dermatitidis]|uniref:General transcription and DNA repair factor IIH subunit TFB4 n=1 Tax=Exophiala dermatitidis TaxID=5970 RepID=A0AAN6ISG7_EXODE|nr:RNA polymerase II transcription factor B subunit 4 [Exophiala dermatitidis]KAJ4510017.1 RNA polymerase II transcription factor B subunit 4 [Exophiala dermatitidis]KAJ4521730.1 RNA polymerase II transcription factor B subunit 4 [Exophiala dermatitidis]KAJ4539421.1 RNA polymerase II transcription factor B subunit 4 [Exophiala dermatitidis]KAJ4542788.1 RNA polymerase II transcription factor B subunit 4 [Exophiala dermatitidis]